MRITQFGKKGFHNIESKHLFKFHTATLVILAIVALSAIIVLAWFYGEGTITRIFSQINAFEQKPPMWLAAPMVTLKYLLVPTVAVFIALLVVMKISPQPRVWSRLLVVGMLIFLTDRYLTWRIFTTLNVATPLNGVFSLGLFALEMIMLVSSTIQLFLMLSVKDRRREASQNALAVINESFTPEVDILITTYNEPEFILRRTIIGCQALDYSNKQIYLLDDTRRPEMRALAGELGCKYLTRSDNRHAKAGNLNSALNKINGKFI